VDWQPQQPSTPAQEDPVSEKDSDKDGDAAEKPASDPMVLEAGLQAVPLGMKTVWIFFLTVFETESV